ncbi:MAG: TIGR04211 family SH3 domain-containing protein [Pedobacter sp.]
MKRPITRVEISKRCERIGPQLLHTDRHGLNLSLRLLMVLVLLGASISTAWGAYITDQIPVTLRRGPGTGYRILKSLTSSAKIEILEDGDDYVKVRTADGTEGYVLKQYVSSQEPQAVIAERLQREQLALRKKLDDLTEQNKKLQGVEAELQKITGQYERLQQGAQNITETMAERDRLQQENAAHLQKITSLEAENHYLWRNNILRWFFAGAGVLCLGWLLGRRPPRRTRSF